MTALSPHAPGKGELRAARRAGWPALSAVAAFSLAVNALMLTGPLFMLQVYDRVLTSRSVETLVALFVLVVGLFLLMAVLDMARGQVMRRLAARFQTGLQIRVLEAGLREPDGPEGLADLDAVVRALGAPVMLALFDLPFAPLFLLAVFALHPLLGLVALAGGAVLVLLTLANQTLARGALDRATREGIRAGQMAGRFRDEGEAIAALGMRGAVARRWLAARDAATAAGLRAGDITGGFASLARALRLLLQSAMLAAGAWLALRGAVTPGAMIAGSILMGRALAPVDQITAGWAQIQRALSGWHRLAGLLDRQRPAPPRTALPRPEARLEVTGLAIRPPGATAPILHRIGFSLPPGSALGVIGPTGAGKSTLARALVGALPPAAGEVRLGGASLDQYDPDILGGLIGYLPQRPLLFDGSVAENIARLAGNPDPQRVVAAAQAAAAHGMILALPKGYDTPIGQIAGRLSGGQIQRIGLARALYGMPVLLVLDEPDAHLDHEGTQALGAAIRAVKARGGSVVAMAHRPGAIAECDWLLVLRNGGQARFGPREAVLRDSLHQAGPLPGAGRTLQGVMA